MDKKEIIKKIIQKKEFSELPKKDIAKVFMKFDKSKFSDEEKIKFSRAALKKVFTSFMGRRIMNVKNKDFRWVLTHHISTKERIAFYPELYQKIFNYFGKEKINVLDLGCGVNGFSYNYFNDLGFKVNYFGVEAVGQLVKLTNYYFKTKNIFSSKIFHESLFNLDKIKKIINQVNSPRVIFLFKVLDSLEVLEKDYSKKLLKEIVPLVDFVVVSFATKSFYKKISFKVKRNWILDFIEENFKTLDNFELGSERYFVLSGKR